MATLEQLREQIESIKDTLCTISTRIQQYAPPLIFNEITPLLDRLTTTTEILYLLASNIALRQNDLTYDNALLRQQLTALEKNSNSTNMPSSLAAVEEDKDFRSNWDYIKDVKGLTQHCELVLDATQSMSVVIGIYAMHFSDNMISQYTQDIAQRVFTLLELTGNFVVQLDSLIKTHNSLKGLIANLEHNYSRVEAQAAASYRKKDDENFPTLDFDSHEAKVLFSVPYSSFPPLVPPSNPVSPETSAYSSPSIFSVNSDSPEKHEQLSSWEMPSLTLPSAAHASNSSALSSNLTSQFQLYESEITSRKKFRATEDKPEQLKRTKKSFNLKDLL